MTIRKYTVGGESGEWVQTVALMTAKLQSDAYGIRSSGFSLSEWRVPVPDVPTP
jgi:hypothetical protein